jgi:hypothetical protein
MDNNQHYFAARKFPRSQVQGLFRVYSSICAGSQMVGVHDISKGGAYLGSRWVPIINEIVTCKALNEVGQEIFTVNGRVAWANDKDYAGKLGFGIEFMRSLTEEEERIFTSIRSGLDSSSLTPLMPFRRSLRRGKF